MLGVRKLFVGFEVFCTDVVHSDTFLEDGQVRVVARRDVIGRQKAVEHGACEVRPSLNLFKYKLLSRF